MGLVSEGDLSPFETGILYSKDKWMDRQCRVCLVECALVTYSPVSVPIKPRNYCHITFYDGMVMVSQSQIKLCEDDCDLRLLRKISKNLSLPFRKSLYLWETSRISRRVGKSWGNGLRLDSTVKMQENELMQNQYKNKQNQWVYCTKNVNHTLQKQQFMTLWRIQWTFSFSFQGEKWNKTFFTCIDSKRITYRHRPVKANLPCNYTIRLNCEKSIRLLAKINVGP